MNVLDIAFRGARRTRAAFVGKARLVGTVLLMAGLCFAFVKMSAAHAARYNTNPKASDQSAYLVQTHQQRENWVFAEGARGPLYPLLLIPVYRQDADRQVFFERAKALTVGLTAAAWLGVWFLLRRHLPNGQALAAWATIGFVSFVHYAPYVKAEALFFVAQLATFLLLGRVLLTQTWRAALLAGVALAVTWALKSSALLLLPPFLAAAALKLAVRLWRSRGTWRERLRAIAPRAAAPAVAVVTFLLVSSPFLLEHQRKFGNAFYNVNSTFYMWYDDWGEVKRGTRAHGDRAGWPDMPESELPSAKKYFATHSTEQIVARLRNGLDGSAAGMDKLGMIRYGFTYLVAVAIGCSMNPRRALRLAATHWPLLLYSLSFFAIHTASCAWFEPLTGGPRFMAAGFAPFVVAAAVALFHVSKPAETGGAPRLDLAAALAFGVALILAYDILELSKSDVSVARGGR